MTATDLDLLASLGSQLLILCAVILGLPPLFRLWRYVNAASAAPEVPKSASAAVPEDRRQS